MSTDLFNAEFVESYLNNELSADSRQQFEQHLKNNPEFSEFFSLFNEIDKALAENDVMELRKELHSIFEVASETWIENAPMVKIDPFEMEIENAIREDDVMHLRALLNDIHELNSEELVAAQHTSMSESNCIDDFSFLAEDDGLLSKDSSPFEKEMFQAIMEEDVMELRNQLQIIGKEANLGTNKQPFIRRFSKYAAIASVFLLVLLGGTFWKVSDMRPMPADKAVANYFEPYQKSVLRGEEVGNSIQTNRTELDKIYLQLQNAYVEYREGNYEHAVKWFEEVDIKQLEGNDGLKMETLFYSGISYLMINDTENAIENFNNIIKNRDNTSFGDDADWYLAACYLKVEGTEPKGIDLLRSIAMLPDHEKYAESIKVLKKLKKLE